MNVAVFVAAPAAISLAKTMALPTMINQRLPKQVGVRSEHHRCYSITHGIGGNEPRIVCRTTQFCGNLGPNICSNRDDPEGKPKASGNNTSIFKPAIEEQTRGPRR